MSLPHCADALKELEKRLKNGDYNKREELEDIYSTKTFFTSMEVHDTSPCYLQRGKYDPYYGSTRDRIVSVPTSFESDPTPRIQFRKY